MTHTKLPGSLLVRAAILLPMALAAAEAGAAPARDAGGGASFARIVVAETIRHENKQAFALMGGGLLAGLGALHWLARPGRRG